MHVRAGVMHAQYYWARSSLTCTILSLSTFFLSLNWKKKLSLLLTTLVFFFLHKLIQIFNCHDRCICSLIYVSIMLNASSFCLVFNSTCKHISFFFKKGGGVCILLQDTFNSLSFYFILYLIAFYDIDLMPLHLFEHLVI